MLWGSYINYFDISECSTLRRTQRAQLCIKQPVISRVIHINVSEKCSKNEEFRGRPRESFILEHPKLTEIPKNDVDDQGTCQD